MEISGNWRGRKVEVCMLSPWVIRVMNNKSILQFQDICINISLNPQIKQAHRLVGSKPGCTPPSSLLLATLSGCFPFPSSTHPEPALIFPHPSAHASSLQLLPLRGSKQQGALFYLITVLPTSLPSSGNQLQHGWPAFLFWPVTEKDIDQSHICVRCMVSPLGYSQGISPGEGEV